MAKKTIKFATVNPSLYAPKSVENHESVLCAKRKYVAAVIGATKWVDHDLYEEICKPWTEMYGTWVAGKGLVKNGKIQKNSVSKATATKTKKQTKSANTFESRLNALEKAQKKTDAKIDKVLALLEAMN